MAATEKLTIRKIIIKYGRSSQVLYILHEKIQSNNPGLHIIASGGVANMQDLEQLRSMNLFGVIVGKAFYEGRITLEDLAQFAKESLC